jgi:HPr kinase/phosphorylase
MAHKVFLRDLLENPGDIDLKLTAVTADRGLRKEITHPDVNRPGLSLAGFFDFFAYDRVQIFGKGESAFIRSFNDEQARDRLEAFFKYDVFCCIFTHGEEPTDIFVDFAQANNTPVLITEISTTRFISYLNHIITSAHAPEKSIHGTLVDVFGVGALIIGHSGVGKSETALELLERGHRLIADDIVNVTIIQESLLVGEGSKLIKHHMEIRGLGVLNVRDVFGIRSVRNRKRIELIVELEDWDQSNQYDRFGLNDNYYTLLGINVPYVLIPVKPGRNIPVLIESAALNQRLKKMGVYSAKELDERIIQWMKAESKHGRKKSDDSG